eukprot:gnl/Chilomastix_cuspidata/11321.p3 GENE.gnl/Chilomastix_cuspidata/11321~~gnl/Chilomastix_cuspidata/11321.p3  ORF type:complete len:104 (+),score=1.38 gnl/Chilomastix_cuspidata/11321:109-420(+)
MLAAAPDGTTREIEDKISHSLATLPSSFAPAAQARSCAGLGHQPLQGRCEAVSAGPRKAVAPSARAAAPGSVPVLRQPPGCLDFRAHRLAASKHARVLVQARR